MPVKGKRQGLGLEMRSFRGKNGEAYLVFRTANGSFHVFTEVEAKEAARECGSRVKGNTRQMWAKLWKES
jgi:hypothetical protein